MDACEQRERRARFWKKYLRLTRGRVTALRALMIAAEEEQDAELRNVLRDVHGVVYGGTPLSEALRRHPGTFSPSIVELVVTAEKTGAWDEILSEIAEGLLEGTFE